MANLIIKFAPQNKVEKITKYYLQNGAIATARNERDDKQTTVIRSSLVEAGIWSLVGSSAHVEEFMPFVAHYNLTGIMIGKDVVNFNLGSVIKNNDSAVER